MDLQVVLAVCHSMTLYCENSRAVANSKEPKIHNKVKYIKSKYHLIRDIVDQGNVTIVQDSVGRNSS